MERGPTTQCLRAHRNGCGGLSLVELVLVVAVLSIAALVVVPALEPTNAYRLDLAAAELAESLRFARGEALRHAAPFGVEVDGTESRARVFRDTSGALPPTPLFDVRHPVSQRLYTLDFDDDTATRGVTLSVSTSWAGTCLAPDTVGFDADGAPRCGNPWGVLLDSGALTLSYAGAQRVVALEPITGRVTVQ